MAGTLRKQNYKKLHFRKKFLADYRVLPKSEVIVLTQLPEFFLGKIF